MMNLNYFKYTFKKYLPLYILLLIVYLVCFPTLTLIITQRTKDLLIQFIYIPTIIFMITGYLLPIWDLRFLYFKSVGNLYLTLPVKPTTLHRTSMLYHMITNMVLYSFAISLGFGILAMKQITYYYEYQFIFLGLVNVVYMSLYLFQSFIASRCYNIREVIFLSLLYMLLPAALVFAINMGLNRPNTIFTWPTISFIGSTDNLARHFIQRSFSNFSTEFRNYSSIFVGLIVCIVLYGLTTYRLNRIKTELLGETSDSLFSKKLLLPVYLFIVLLYGNYTMGYVSLFVNIVLIIAYFMYTVLRYRKLKINLHVVLLYILCFGLTNLIAFLVVN